MFIIYSFIDCQVIFIREKYNFTPENNDFTVANIFWTQDKICFKIGKKNIMCAGTNFISNKINSLITKIFVCAKIYFRIDKIISFMKTFISSMTKKNRL